jgi:hypothetical protein
VEVRAGLAKVRTGRGDFTNSAAMVHGSAQFLGWPVNAVDVPDWL